MVLFAIALRLLFVLYFILSISTCPLVKKRSVPQIGSAWHGAVEFLHCAAVGGPIFVERNVGVQPRELGAEALAAANWRGCCGEVGIVNPNNSCTFVS